MNDSASFFPAPTDPPFYVAHTPGKYNPEWHTLVEHTLCVANKARTFATPLGYGAGGIAYYLGLLHDLGKFTPEFQKYLRDCDAGRKRVKGSAPHKQHGAFAATILDKAVGKYWRLPLHGHHGGLKSPDMTNSDIRGTFEGASIDAKPYVQKLLALAAQVDPRLSITAPDLAPLAASPLWQQPESMELFVRLLFSCLVDADALDTEAHNDPSKSASRDVKQQTLVSLRDALVMRQATDFKKAMGPVNNIRREVYDDCRRMATINAPGFFTLTVPTGGGKTRSSLAFALEHAVQYEKRHIIYAIPYTSIIDQTVDVFRDIFGDDPGTVLEHHSAIEARTSGTESEQERLNELESWRLLAAEDWDAPLIVTTTVQLFESLFARKPGACRKLHRLANSVIVLDEAQCLPAHLLGPIRSGLKTLVELFGATVVFCTATQPAHAVDSPWLAGIDATPIISLAQTAAHFAALKRVDWTVEREPWGWDRVAEEVRKKPDVSTLCVTNTRKQALELIAALQAAGISADNLLHLSTLLCPAHRRAVITAVRERLRNEQFVILVSTQVIEAGVDLSFPRLFRAFGPLERMIQAAGRCNRNDERAPAKGEVVIFQPEQEAMPQGFYDMCATYTKNLADLSFDDPDFVTLYFAQMYADLAAGADAKQIKPAREQFQYEEVADKFRMITQDTEDVFVTGYRSEQANAILAKIEKRAVITRALWREASPYMVSLYRYMVNDSNAPELIPGLGLRIWKGEYDERLGIPLDADVADTILTAEDLVM